LPSQRNSPQRTANFVEELVQNCPFLMLRQKNPYYFVLFSLSGYETDPIQECAGRGERALLAEVRKRTARSSAGGLRLGIGDDCALLAPRQGEEVAVTTDLSIAGRHFRLDWHPPEAVGHRALARGLSDLAAMGARPVAAFLSLGLPRELTVAPRRRPGGLGPPALLG
jgi:hypothetical protein